MHAIRLTVYGHAKPAGSKTTGVTKDGRRYVRDASGKAGAEWRQAIRQAAGHHMDGQPLLNGPLALQLVFYMPRPKNHYGKKGLLPSAPHFPTVKPDIDKLARSALDGLEGTLVRTDSQFVQVTMTKRYGEPARAEITIENPSVMALLDSPDQFLNHTREPDTKTYRLKPKAQREHDRQYTNELTVTGRRQHCRQQYEGRLEDARHWFNHHTCKEDRR